MWRLVAEVGFWMAARMKFERLRLDVRNETNEKEIAEDLIAVKQNSD